MAKVVGHRAPFDRADSGSQRPKEEDKLDPSLIWCCLVLTPTPLDPDCRLPLTLRDDLEPVAGHEIAAPNGGSVKSRRQQSGGPQVIDRAGRPVMPRAMSAPSG